MSFLNRARAALRADPAGPPTPPSPLTIRLRHIDIELAKLRARQPRTDVVRAAWDVWLDRRLVLAPARDDDGGEGGSA